MLKKVFSVFCLFFSIGAFCVFGSAEEVPVSHSEDVTYTSVYHTASDYQISVTTDSWNYCPEPTQTNWIGGNAERDIKTLYVAPYPTTIEGTGSSSAAYYMSLYDTIQGYYNPPVPSFSVTLTDCTVTLDTDLLPAGYYRYIFHFWYGVAFSNAYSVTTNIEPSYLGSSFYSEGNTSISFNGLEPCQNYFAGGSYPFRSDLLEFTFDTVWFHDGNTSETEFNLGYYISQLGKQVLGYDMTNYTIGRLYYLNIWANNRYYSELYGNVEPPVTPTPSPTPYPGQDTQESINQGVQVIVNALDISATPIPTPADLTIDETVFDLLDNYTLPDVSNSDVATTYSDLWSVFNPLWVFLGSLFGALLITSIFLYILRGGFI